MEKLTEKWWFWVIFAVITLLLFGLGVFITNKNVDTEYQNLTEFNQYLKDSNENRQTSLNDIYNKYYQ